MKQIRKSLVSTALLLAVAMTGCAKDGENSAVTEHSNTPAMEQAHTSIVPTDGVTAAAPMEGSGEGILAQGSCGEQLTWTLDGSGLLTVSGSGEMDSYGVGFYAPWFDYRMKIQAVSLSDGVTTIGNSAFCQCYKMENVTIPDSMTGIGKSAFSECSALTSIALPNSVTSIGTNAFSKCSALTSVVIPNGVTEIGTGTFIFCASLTSVTFPDGLTKIGAGAFGNCASLGSVTIPSSVTSIEELGFSDCDSLVIYGEVGSCAETYAKEHDIPFQAQ